ncbi:hypothetical protein G6F31_021399 [Rhizopus arrhizus]|nr:hypothetical protein G6F31_021399 [Rhizopus arrhizus]
MPGAGTASACPPLNAISPLIRRRTSRAASSQPPPARNTTSQPLPKLSSSSSPVFAWGELILNSRSTV